MNTKLKEYLTGLAFYIIPFIGVILLLKYGVLVENKGMFVFLAFVPIANIILFGILSIINIVGVLLNLFFIISEFVK